MGLGSFLKKAVKSVAPLVSVAAPFFGPLGVAAGAVAGAIGGRNGNGGMPAPMAATPPFQPPTSFTLPGGAMTSLTGLPAALPVGLGGILPSLGRALPAIGGLVGGAVRVGAGLIRTAAGKIRGVMLASGRFVSSKKAAQLARRVGIDAAAAALGVSAVELAEMVLAEQERAGRRRGRGVSAADLRRTRRTIRTVERMHDQIVRACRDAVPARRRAPVVFGASLPAHRHKLVSVK